MLPSLEGNLQGDVKGVLDGDHGSRQDPIKKCYQAALTLGFQVFAIAANGMCASSPTSQQDYKKAGKATTCNKNGTGGGLGVLDMAQMYEINGKLP